MDIDTRKLQILQQIFETRTIDDLSLRDGVDYRLLGLIWQNIVEKQINHKPQLLKDFTGSRNFTLHFKYKVPIEETEVQRLPHTSNGYFVLDGYAINHKPLKYQSTIIEMKLGLQNIGIKEIEYLYYHPHSNMICVLFYPHRLDRPHEIYETIIEPLVDEFNRLYNPHVVLEIPFERISFVDRYQLGLDRITEKKLREYQTRVDYFAKIVVQILSQNYPNALLKGDFLDLTGAHHEVIGNILEDLLSKSIIRTETCDILNSSERISKDITLYYMQDDIYQNPKFQDLLTKKTPILTQSQLDSLPLRQCVESDLRTNDRSILCYLSHYHDRWISVPDLLDNVQFSSQGELRRRLEALVDTGMITTRQGYLLDLGNSSSRSYEGHFYQVRRAAPEPGNCSCAQQPPTRVYSPVQLTSNELSLLLFLEHHQVTTDHPITISDLATSLDINQSTLQIAVQRLSETELLATRQGWVLSRGKIDRMRSSPLVFLDKPLPEELQQLADRYDLSLPERTDHLLILAFPLTPSESLVVDLISRGADLGQLTTELRLNSIPKRNRSMIKSIINRLSDPQAMEKRGITPVLNTDSLQLTVAYSQHQLLRTHITHMSSLDQ